MNEQTNELSSLWWWMLNLYLLPYSFILVTGLQVHFFPPDRNIGKKPICQSSKRQVIEGHFFFWLMYFWWQRRRRSREMSWEFWGMGRGQKKVGFKTGGGGYFEKKMEHLFLWYRWKRQKKVQKKSKSWSLEEGGLRINGSLIFQI